jgi:hypothetical protein
MKTTMKNLTGALLIAVAALGTARPQSTAPELRLSDIRVQQPQETIFASAPCQRARETDQGWISQSKTIDPKTLVRDLKPLVEKSDEVLLAGLLDYVTVLSPSGGSTVAYSEVRIIRSWKGPHRSGDTLIFGVPFGRVSCEPTTSEPILSWFEVTPDGSWFLWPDPDDVSGVDVAGGPNVFTLFLRRPDSSETQLIQGLLPAAGEGLQGLFAIQVPETLPSEAEQNCSGVPSGAGVSPDIDVRKCEAYLETSQSPVMVLSPQDPLRKKYGGMPISEFLKVVQSVTAGRVQNSHVK